MTARHFGRWGDPSDRQGVSSPWDWSLTRRLEVKLRGDPLVTHRGPESSPKSGRATRRRLLAAGPPLPLRHCAARSRGSKANASPNRGKPVAPRQASEINAQRRASRRSPHLQHRAGVDIHHDPNRRRQLGDQGLGRTKRRLQRRVRRAFEQQLPPRLPLDAGDGRRSRPQQPHAMRGRWKLAGNRFPQRSRRARRALGVRAFDPNRSEPAERRPRERFRRRSSSLENPSKSWVSTRAMGSACGLYVCTSTRPGSTPRPARPPTCVSR